MYNYTDPASLDVGVAHANLLTKTLIAFAGFLAIMAAGVFSAPAFPIPFGVVIILFFALSFGVQFVRKNLALAVVMAVIWSFVTGIFLAPLLYAYARMEPQVLSSALLTATASFGVVGLIGIKTRMDLSKMAGFLVVGALALVVTMVVGFFSQAVFNITTNIWFNLFGTAIFLGFTLFDFWRITNKQGQRMRSLLGVTENVAAIQMSVNLLLDFINVFLFLLRVFGGRGGGGRK